MASFHPVAGQHFTYVASVYRNISLQVSSTSPPSFVVPVSSHFVSLRRTVPPFLIPNTEFMALLCFQNEAACCLRSHNRRNQIFDGFTSETVLHTVTKFDTLSGVTIKYGVEVADIKRLNGLVTDLQMFAMKTLRIPLPGRHFPSPSLCNGHDTPQRPSSSEKTPSNRRHSDIFDSFQSIKLTSSTENVSPAMCSLQGFYGLQQSERKSASEGFDMAMYRNGGAKYLEDGSFSAPSNIPLSHHRKSKSVANGLMFANGLHDPLLCQESDNSNSDKWINKLLRRRQKSEADFSAFPPEKLLKEENSGISAISSRGLALRPKSSARIATGVDGESSGPNPIPLNLGEPLPTDAVSGVRKSLSTSSLQDSDSGALSSLWPTSKWSLKADFQALSSAAIPMFDGLPKPTSRKNKAALD